MNLSLSLRSASLFTTLALVAACGDDVGGGGAGGTTSSTTTVASTTTNTTTHASTSGTTTAATTTVAATTASSSSSGTGGMSDAPVMALTKIGDPLWEPVDYHEFAAPVGPMFMDFHTILAGILPPPNHQDHPDIGIGPGMAHAGPYDNEFGPNIMALNYVEKTTYTQAEGSLPNAIFSAWMVVPSAGAPTGVSPDGANTPIIPNTLFPISVDFDSFESGMLLDGYSYGFDVPPLDDQLTPPFNGLDGHSHFPLFDATVFDGMPTLPGTIETHINMFDQEGNGWHIVLTAHAT